jgi:single-stranded DNA-binding protein
MASFNRVILAGNLSRDPEIKFTNEGVPVTNFELAVNRVRSKKEGTVDFFDVTAWRELGEAVANHKRKGDPVLVEGRLQYRSWEAEDAPSGARWTSWRTASSSSARARAPPAISPGPTPRHRSRHRRKRIRDRERRPINGRRPFCVSGRESP